MFSYEVYKVLHIAMILLIVVCACAQFYSATPPKIAKIGAGVSSFLILVGGMGMLARLGVSHGEGFPGWVIAKIVLWRALAIQIPVIGKRGSDQLKRKMPVIILGQMIVISYIAIYKPF